MKSVSPYLTFTTLLLLVVLLSPVIGLVQEQSQSVNSSPINLEDSPLLEISKDWEYQWGEPQKKGDLSNSAWKTIQMPINPPERKGNRILWLRKKMPYGSWKNPTILIDGKGVLLTFELFLDGDLIYKFGKLTPSGQGNISGISPHLIPLNSNFEGKILMFKIFSDYSNIGIRGNALLGSKSDLILRILSHDISNYLLGIIMIFIGLVELSIYREGKMKTGPISMFGILAVSIGLYTVTLTSLKDLVFYSPVFWFNIYIVAMTLIPVGAVGFIWQNFRPDKGNYLYRIVWFHIGYALLCQGAFILALNSLLPISVGTLLLNLLRWLLILEMILIIGIIGKDSLIKKNQQARIYFCGLTPIIIAGILDALTGLGKIESSHSYVPWALMIFIMSLELIQRKNNLNTQARLRNYAEELERKSREKAELNSDLHDGVGGIVTNIKFLSEMGMKNPSIEGMKETFFNISALSSDGLVEIGGFIQNIDEEVADWTMVLKKFVHLGEKMIKSFGLSFDLREKIDNNMENPDHFFFINLLRIYREALTNITKHSKATCVRVNLVVNKEQLRLSITDDGVGFGDDLTKGRGLNNMKVRAQKLGGKLSVSQGKGTCVLLEIDMIKVVPSSR